MRVTFDRHRSPRRAQCLRDDLAAEYAAGPSRLLSSYEAVVADYTPVQEQLGALKYNRDDPARYFRMI